MGLLLVWILSTGPGLAQTPTPSGSTLRSPTRNSRLPTRPSPFPTRSSVGTGENPEPAGVDRTGSRTEPGPEDLAAHAARKAAYGGLRERLGALQGPGAEAGPKLDWLLRGAVALGDPAGLMSVYPTEEGEVEAKALGAFAAGWFDRTALALAEDPLDPGKTPLPDEATLETVLGRLGRKPLDEGVRQYRIRVLRVLEAMGVLELVYRTDLDALRSEIASRIGETGPGATELPATWDALMKDLAERERIRSGEPAPTLAAAAAVLAKRPVRGDAPPPSRNLLAAWAAHLEPAASPSPPSPPRLVPPPPATPVAAPTPSPAPGPPTPAVPAAATPPGPSASRAPSTRPPAAAGRDPVPWPTLPSSSGSSDTGPEPEVEAWRTDGRRPGTGSSPANASTGAKPRKSIPALAVVMVLAMFGTAVLVVVLAVKKAMAPAPVAAVPVDPKALKGEARSFGVPVAGTLHQVATSHDAASGHVAISVGGKPVPVTPLAPSGGLSGSAAWSFPCGDETAVFHALEDTRGFRYDISRGGISVTTGDPVKLPAGQLTPELMVYMGLGTVLVGLPLILLLLLGGAIGGGFAGVGLSASFWLKDQEFLPKPARLMASLVVVALCWGGYLVIAGGLSAVLGR